MSAPQPPPKILPMRWVVAAILVFIAGYTYLRLHYAKRGGSFEPYHDLRQEISVARLLKLGYRRIPVTVERPAEPLAAAAIAPDAAEVLDAFGGLPAELDGALASKPILPAVIDRVAAPRAVPADATYRLQFACSQPDYSTQLRDAILYRKDRRIILLPEFEKIPGELLARSKDSVVLANFSVHSLAPGRYSVLLCGGRRSKSWSFVVR